MCKAITTQQGMIIVERPLPESDFQSLFPLTENQYDVWLDCQLDNHSAKYNIGGYVVIDKMFNEAQLRLLFEMLIVRHDVLRLEIVEGDERPQQRVLSNVSLALPIIDFTASDNPEEDSQEWMENDMQRAFHLSQAPLWRFAIIRLSEEKYYCYCSFHHLINDGLSLHLIITSVADIYDAHINGYTVPIAPNYREVVKADAKYKGSKRYIKDALFWEQEYKSLPTSIFTEKNNSSANGGAGLARGYLHHPELTAERFVNIELFGKKQRLYRSGDRARWNAEGELEFFGRLDDQIKLRGYRIELGEVESVLNENAQIEQAVVVLTGEGEDKQLNGYVIVKQEKASQQEYGQSYIDHWHMLYQHTFADYHTPSEFDITGWNSSYTGEPIASGEMVIWIEETVAQIRQLLGTRVLEIGCGTGLLLTRLAAETERYIGLDFSEVVLARLSATVALRDDLSHVELHQGLAHELEFLEDDSIDLVVLNSVVQYFPDMAYLLQVLEQISRVCTADARIFMGDIRNFNLLEAYHASVTVHKADENAQQDWVQGCYRHAVQNEEELLISPAFFDALAQYWPGVARTEVRLKPGYYDNELSRFRYDVSIRLGERQQLSDDIHWIDWDVDGVWRDAVTQQITTYPEQHCGVRALPDIRVSEAIQYREQLEHTQSLYVPLKDLRQTIKREGEDPNAVYDLAKTLNVGLTWQGVMTEGTYQVLFNPQWVLAEKEKTLSLDYYNRYANSPCQREFDSTLGIELKTELAERLPDYRIPNAIMVLERFPLTPNGKVDKKRLPVPGRSARILI